jgi:hypothetical protein
MDLGAVFVLDLLVVSAVACVVIFIAVIVVIAGEFAARRIQGWNRGFPERIIASCRKKT